jgi:hypothetical protein
MITLVIPWILLVLVGLFFAIICVLFISLHHIDRDYIETLEKSQKETLKMWAGTIDQWKETIKGTAALEEKHNALVEKHNELIDKWNKSIEADKKGLALSEALIRICEERGIDLHEYRMLKNKETGEYKNKAVRVGGDYPQSLFDQEHEDF